jgi:signal transduction histidine kinase
VKSSQSKDPPGDVQPAGAKDHSSAFEPLDALHDLEQGVLCVDGAWRIAFANRAWERSLGVRASDYIGSDLWQSFPPFLEAPESAMVRETARDGKPRSFSLTYDDRRHRGTYDVRVSRISGGIVMLVLRDNSRRLEARERERENEELRMRAEQLLEQAQVASQAKSVFLATISHELRTPLTALTGYGELLADEIVGPLSGPQHEVLERMRSVTHHLTAMIDELLAYTRLEGGRESVNPTEVSARELVFTTIAVIDPLARSKGLECHAEVPDGAPVVVTDAETVRQILVNLAGNAVKFTDEGSVTIAVSTERDDVRFEVRDTGSGIAPEDQRRLFQPFTQLDSGLTRRHGGTGLGLYISQRLAALIGGRLHCESKPGEGSVFTLALPCRPRDQATAA